MCPCIPANGVRVGIVRLSVCKRIVCVRDVQMVCVSVRECVRGRASYRVRESLSRDSRVSQRARV